MKNMNNRKKTLLSLSAGVITLSASPAYAATLLIANPSFESDTPGSSGATAVLGATGWTIATSGTTGSGGQGDWFTTTAGLADSGVDPDAAADGNNWLSSNRLAGGSTSSADPSRLVQLIDISGDAGIIDLGIATISLGFSFADNDPLDNGTVNITFFSDVSGTTPIGTPLTTGVITETGGGFDLPANWVAQNLSGSVPALSRSLQIEIVNDRTGGSAGNTHFDNFAGAIVPEPSSGILLLGGLGMLTAFRRRSK